MAYVTYTALRKLIAGHTASTAYTIDFESSVLDQGLPITRRLGESLDGTTEAILSRVDETWSITTSFITSAALPQWKEFLAAVAAAEGFTFDAYGSSAVPDNPQSVIMTGQPTITRVSTVLTYQIQFNVRVL